MKDLLLFPCNGNTREALGVVAAINKITPTWNVVGYLDDNKELHDKMFHGIPVLGDRSKLAEHSNAWVLAVPGRAQNFHLRKEIIQSLAVSPSRFATLIHPRAEIGPDCKVGVNVLVMSGALLTVNVSLGDHTMVMANTVISHDSLIGDYTLVGSSVTIAGSVSVGENCYLASGSRVRETVKLADCTLVGMGAVVLSPTESESVVVGIPARPIRSVRG